MFGYYSSIYIKQLSHCLLRTPNRFVLDDYLYLPLVIRKVIEYELHFFHKVLFFIGLTFADEDATVSPITLNNGTTTSILWMNFTVMSVRSVVFIVSWFSCFLFDRSFPFPCFQVLCRFGH